MAGWHTGASRCSSLEVSRFGVHVSYTLERDSAITSIARSEAPALRQTNLARLPLSLMAAIAREISWRLTAMKRVIFSDPSYDLVVVHSICTYIK